MSNNDTKKEEPESAQVGKAGSDAETVGPVEELREKTAKMTETNVTVRFRTTCLIGTYTWTSVH